ncbi:hypothetical protein GCM10027037_01020 [Mucilaginibacter koreensis]
MNRLLTSKLLGYVVSNFTAFIIIGITAMFKPDAGVLVFSEFVIIPMLMGIISAWFWRKLELSSSQLVGYSLTNTVIAILMSTFFLREGIVCLVIVSPLLVAFILAGAFMGRNMFKRNNQNLNISIVSLLVVVFIADSVSNHRYVNKVSDEVVINAPVSEVWKHVTAYKKNTHPNKYWLFQMGMPSPVQSTADGLHVGANRKCIFSNGYVFDEKIVIYQPNVNLTFDITSQPRDPEIMGHIDILRGQFILKDNGNQTTTLIGNSWYELHVFPVWYYDIWAKSVTRNVHLRVMDYIKELSETPQ